MSPSAVTGHNELAPGLEELLPGGLGAFEVSNALVELLLSFPSYPGRTR